MDPITIARALAAAHPGARLPCPVCAASVNGENLERHLTKTHGGHAPTAGRRWTGTGWLGAAPCSVALLGDSVVLHHWLGLARRVVTLPCTIAVGGLTATRSDPLLSSHADDLNDPGTTVRVGRYLRLEGQSVITIGCRHNTGFSTHWDRAGWRDGGRRGACDLLVAREAMVALEYALAERGLLTPGG